MQSRMNNPAMLLPDALPALQNIAKIVTKAAQKSDLPMRTIHLVYLRASQINGCSVCVDMHARDARNAGETVEKLFATAAWRDAPYFSDAERAALELTESVTRLSDRADPVPDAVWHEVSKYYNEPARAALVLAISSVNLWNRLNVATKQIAGEWVKQAAGESAKKD